MGPAEPSFQFIVTVLLDELIQQYKMPRGSEEQTVAEIEAVYLKHNEEFENCNITLPDIHARIKRYGVYKTLRRLRRQVYVTM